ncbi:hypothetical protein AX15_006651 [Amanita polypyramis BW_CC]|nr:hypothetical protein AX15_006651 [Amanita polypyramis BW_CC]
MDSSIKDDHQPSPSPPEHQRHSVDDNPATPTSPTSPQSKQKKLNPLNDLIETERLYVEQLTGVIRKIAAAWSRSNLPPPELDSMFRSIEAVYKANKGLYSKLKDIGTNPSSPKALGDLLMKWINDLETPYTNYCTKYCCGFDHWEPVKSNYKLPDVLRNFSALFPPTSSEQSIWTLDGLFLLPKARLKYYRKLYNRLLKGTVVGRSDHRLLLRALEKLDALLDTIDSRQSIKVGSSNSSDSLTVTGQNEVVIDLGLIPKSHELKPNSTTHQDDPSLNRSTPGSGIMSEETVPPSKLESNPDPKIPITELEFHLSTERTLDIFTMNPKAVRLQFSPPNLTFKREMRLSMDVLIRFTPHATNIKVVHRRGHIFLLSDLFLICERMTPQEKALRESDIADMWLCYPPLAGKVLRITEVEGQPHALQVAIMKKEFLILETGSVNARNTLKEHIRGCIDFSGSLPPPSKELPPPVPPLITADSNPIQPDACRASLNQTIPSAEAPSYPLRQESLTHAPRDIAIKDGRLANSMSSLSLGPEAQLQRGAQRIPSVLNSYPDPIYSTSHVRLQDYHSRPSIGHIGPHMQNSRSAPLLGGSPTNLNQLNPARPQDTLSFLRQSSHSQQAPSIPPMHAPGNLPNRPPSGSEMRKSSSMRSLSSQYSQRGFPPHPPIPSHVGDYSRQSMPRTGSMGNLRAVPSRPLLPSAQFSSRGSSVAEPSFDDPSPPASPVINPKQDIGPVTSTISAQMKCKVFLQQQHAQWKSLGSAKLKLYCEKPTNIKQLVVESNKSVLISTIVLTDGVERVGKTGVAIELSDGGARTGVIYMLQLQNETSAATLFDSLLAGSDRSG